MKSELRRYDQSETERRVRVALWTEADSISESDLRVPKTESLTPGTSGHRRAPVLAAAAIIALLAGAVAALSIASRSDGVVATNPGVATNPVAGPVAATLSALPQNSSSCAFGGFADYAQHAVKEGDAMVSGTLHTTGTSRQEPDAELGWQYSQVEITINSVLAGQLAPKAITGWVSSGVDFLGSFPAPSSGQKDGGNSAPPAVVSYEGNGGWAVDGKFLGVVHRRSDGTFLLNPTPLIDDRVVVGLGCWGSGGLPTTHQREDMVLASHPPAVISAPVDTVSIEEVRNSLR